MERKRNYRYRKYSNSRKLQNKPKVQYVRKYNEHENDPEPGFSGDSSTWFDEDEYKNQFVAEMDFKGINIDSYFASYSHFHIHEEMLKDEVRTKSYMIACLNNKKQFKDKIVLDIGCGTGILSIFAARAGAKHVYAIDNADIALYARQIVKDNQLEDTVTVIKGKVEEITLPVEKVDIIISEWMGYFLLYESMLDTILFARDKWLAEDGIIMPDRTRINIAAIEDSEYKNHKFGFWDNVYGVDMKCIKAMALTEPLVDLVEKPLVMSDSYCIKDIDLYTVKPEDLNFTHKYSLKINRDDTVYAIVAWFDAFFEKLDNPVKFSTGPFTRTTHWRQTVFYLRETIKAKKGETLRGSIAVRKGLAHFRDLDIKFSFHHDGELDKKNYIQLFKLQ